MAEPDSPPPREAREREPASDRERRRSIRLVALLLFGALGFVGPLLRVVSRPAPPGAWPLPFVFLFSFWAALIGLIAFVVRARRGD